MRYNKTKGNFLFIIGCVCMVLFLCFVFPDLSCFFFHVCSLTGALDATAFVCPNNVVRRMHIQFEYTQWNLHVLFWHINCPAFYFDKTKCNFVLIPEVFELLWISCV